MGFWRTLVLPFLLAFLVPSELFSSPGGSSLNGVVAVSPPCANPVNGCVDFTGVASSLPSSLPSPFSYSLLARVDCPAGAAAGSVSKDFWTDLMDNSNWNKLGGAITPVKCTLPASATWQKIPISYPAVPTLPVGSGRVELHAFFVNPGASWDTRVNNNVLPITVVSSGGGGVTPTPTPSVPPVSDDWQLVWADEFDGNSLNLSKWTYEVNGFQGGNAEAQVYRISPDTLWVKDGLLNIRPMYRPNGVSPGWENCTEPYFCDKVTKWESARIRTLNSTDGHFKYGRIVFNAKMGLMDYAWIAGWAMPTDQVYGGWAASGRFINFIFSFSFSFSKSLS